MLVGFLFLLVLVDLRFCFLYQHRYAQVQTKILFCPRCRIGEHFDLHFATTYEGEIPPGFDIKQRAQEAMRYFCLHLKTTPEMEEERDEEWRVNVIKHPTKPEGIAIITDEMREFVREDFLLVFADHPADITALEKSCGLTQAKQIDHFIENTCFADELKPERCSSGEDCLVTL
jgi:hypothetical protein